jgi:hypothetical protein
MYGRVMCRNGSNGCITRLHSKLAMSHMYYVVCRVDSLCKHFILVESINVFEKDENEITIAPAGKPTSEG